MNPVSNPTNKDKDVRAAIISLFCLSCFCVFPAFSASGNLNPPWWTAPFENTPEAKETVAVAEIFTPGYQAVRDKYIEAVDLQPLIIDSLKLLSALDNDLHITADEEKITIFYKREKYKSLRIKTSSSAEDWAKATAVVIKESRKLSPKIASVNPENIYELLYNSILSRLDKVSHYLPPDYAKQQKISHHGFGDVGISFRRNLNGLEVTDVEVDYKCPLLIGDIITFIDGQSVTSMSSEDVKEAFAGAPETTVEVNLIYKQEPVTLKRKFTPPPVPNMLSMLPSEIALIKLPAFTSDTAGKAEKIIAGLPPKTKALIFDLRGNQGGLLSEAVKLADLFIAYGIITEVKGRAPEATKYYHATPKEIWKNKPIAVLIDGKTVSAGEVFAAAMQKNLRAVIVGASSYGKGTVQTAVPLPNHGEIMLTWAEIYATQGKKLAKNGVTPDICISAQNPCPKAVIQTDEELLSAAIFALKL